MLQQENKNLKKSDLPEDIEALLASYRETPAYKKRMEQSLQFKNFLKKTDEISFRTLHQKITI
jgi:hypothetical protein